MIATELAIKILALREIEDEFEKGYHGASVFCEAEGLTPEQLLKVIAIDRAKEGSNVKFNDGATKWCHEQLGGVQ